MDATRTLAPEYGASTTAPPPMYIPTWWMVVGLRVSSAKTTRSPGARPPRPTLGPARYWARLTRGRGLRPRLLEPPDPSTAPAADHVQEQAQLLDPEQAGRAQVGGDADGHAHDHGEQVT